MAVDYWHTGAMVSANENAKLSLPFMPEEVGQAIMEMKANSAPGPDGFSVTFFQTFWDHVKVVIMLMLQEFFIGTLDMSRLKFGVITLIPKIVGATDQVFPKVCATRLTPMGCGG